LSFGLGECCFLKLWNRAALADPTQRTAFFGAARIFRIFLRQIFKLRAGLQLLKQIFGAMLRIGHAFLVYFAAGPCQRSLNQDMAYLGLLIDAVLVPVLVVISLEIGVRDLDSALNLAEIHDGILDLPFFRDGIVVLRLVTLVERLQFSIRRMQALAQIILFYGGVFELHLAIFFDELLVNLVVTHRSAAGDQRSQLLEEYFFA